MHFSCRRPSSRQSEGSGRVFMSVLAFNGSSGGRREGQLGDRGRGRTLLGDGKQHAAVERLGERVHGRSDGKPAPVLGRGRRHDLLLERVRYGLEGSLSEGCVVVVVGGEKVRSTDKNGREPLFALHSSGITAEEFIG